MSTTLETAALSPTTEIQAEYEAIVVGSGVCGIYQMYRLQELGIRATLLEAGGDVGGTWYRNRYPGCRFDSESVTYCYSFSKELLEEWNWTERFAPRAETERYLRYVVEKFSLRKYMQFNCVVQSAVYDEASRTWSVKVSDGRVLTTRFLLTSIGLLSSPTLPRYKGVDRFEGVSFHTYFAPTEPIDYRGKRVAVVGTGATGVQIISDIADSVADLTVFQRRPNWCAPLHNSKISSEEMGELKAQYDEIFRKCAATPSGFWHQADPRKTLDVPEEERLAFWEALYAAPGFGIWVGNFQDTLLDELANAELTSFIANKIRQRVRDPKLAEKLIPKDHGFGTRRIPLETRYYEAYNRENVHLVDISETPIEEVTRSGIRTSEREFEFDIIVYATGFDAVTGSFDKIDFQGAGGQRLKDKWRDGPTTTLGLMSFGFPNLITLSGPQSGSAGTNFPRGIETAVDWTADLIKFMRANGYTRIEPKKAMEDIWVAEVVKQESKMLLGKQKSWFTGYNSNVDREQKPRHLIYLGGAVRYRKWLSQQVETGYEGFHLS